MTTNIAPGWGRLALFGAPLTLGGRAVYYHESRENYGLDREDGFGVSSPTPVQNEAIKMLVAIGAKVETAGQYGLTRRLK